KKPARPHIIAPQTKTYRRFRTVVQSALGCNIVEYAFAPCSPTAGGSLGPTRSVSAIPASALEDSAGEPQSRFPLQSVLRHPHQSPHTAHRRPWLRLLYLGNPH